MSYFRELARTLYVTTMRRMLYTRRDIAPGRPAIVFAPHQDDETLGCGGTILKKRRHNVRVQIVYMTDGSRSNDFISPAELKSIRAKEAVASAEILGVQRSDLIFLDFPDRDLSSHSLAAERGVLEILDREKPEEVFIPYRLDKHPDHIATNSIVWSAIGKRAKPLVVYEYPVHFWSHWPLISIQAPGSQRQKLSQVRWGLTCGWYLLSEFNCRSFVGDVLDIKRQSLERHQSQMSRSVADPRWKILPEEANGEWLGLLFQDYEIFRRQRLHQT